MPEQQEIQHFAFLMRLKSNPTVADQNNLLFSTPWMHSNPFLPFLITGYIYSTTPSSPTLIGIKLDKIIYMHDNTAHGISKLILGLREVFVSHFLL